MASHRCISCDYRLGRFRIYKRRWSWFGRFKFVLENVNAVRCRDCGTYNFLLGKENIEKIAGVLARELADWPATLSGAQFSWARNYVAEKAKTNELLALWINWEGFYAPRKNRAVAKEIIQCLAERLGCEKTSQLKKLDQMEEIYTKVDEVIKSILKMVADPNGFPTRVEYLQDKGEYIAVVDLKKLAEKQAAAAKKKPQRRKKNTKSAVELLKEKWRDVNGLLGKFSLGPIDWRAFYKFIKNFGGEAICLYINNEKKLAAMTLACFHSDKNIVYASYFLVDEKHLENKDLLAVLFLHLIEFGEKNKVDKIVLKTPRQPELAQEAERIGFLYKTSNVLIFPLNNNPS